MMAILMPFNTTDMMTLSDLRDITQLPDKDLIKQLNLLVNSRVLLTQVRQCNIESQSCLPCRLYVHLLIVALVSRIK